MMNLGSIRPLFNLDAEKSLIGCMLLSDKACTECVRMHSEEEFYRPGHQLIFRAFQRVKARGFEADMVTLQDSLLEGGDLDKCGGMDYLSDIELYVPSASHWVHYSEMVKSLSRLRYLESVSKEALSRINDAEAHETPAQIATWLSAQASSVGGSASGLVRLEDVNESGGDDGLAFGIPQIEKVLATGGAPMGQMTVVVAREKHGKTALKIQMAVNQAERGLGVHYETLADLNPKRLKRRILRCMCGFSERSTADYHGFAREFEEAKDRLERDMELTIGDRTRGGSHDVDDILSGIETLRQRKEKTSCPLVSAYIDYGQKLTSRLFRANDALAIYNYCSAQISDYAERSGISLVVGSQLTEGNEKEGREPITKGSRQWLEDCGLCLWIHRGEGDSAILRVLRSRFGGMGKRVDMIYREEYLRFEAVNP